MAIAFNNLGASTVPDFQTDADQTVYQTSSWSPPAIGLIIVAVYSRNKTAGSEYPTITGNNLTWVHIANTASGRFNLALFGANASGSTTGVTSFTYTVNRTSFVCAFFQATGVDLSGGVAAAFVQSPTNVGTGTSGSVTLNAAGHANNRPISIWGPKVAESITPRTNWTEADEIYTGNPLGIETQHRADAFEVTATATWTSSADWWGIAAELKASSAGTPVNKDLEAIWDVAELVNKDLEANYDIDVLVNKDLEAQYDIFALVNKDIEAQWDIAELVYKDLEAIWDMEGAVSKDLEAQYDILNLVSKDIEAQYDIFNSVYKDLQGLWDIAELVYKDIEAVWDVAGAVNKDLEAQYDILSFVNKDIEAQYDVLSLINKDIEAVWDIEALEGIVSKDLTMVWDVLRAGTALWNRFPYKKRTDR